MHEPAPLIMSPAASTVSPAPTAACATVLHLTDCAGGGVPVVIDAIVGALGGEVAFIGQAPTSFVHRQAIRIETGGERSRHPLQIWRRLRDLTARLETRRPGLIHAHSSFGGVYGALLSRRLGVPLVYSPHASPAMIPGQSRSQRLIARLEWLSCHQARRVLACSDDEAEALGGVCPADRIEVVPNGVLVEAVPVVPATWDVVAVGRLSPQKRPDLFVQVIAAARQRLPGLRVAWLGGGEPPSMPGAEGVHWLGEVSEDEVLRTLAAARIFASTSDYEGLSLAALKAAVSGCHLLLRDTCGNRAPILLGAEGTRFTSIDEGAQALVDRVTDAALQQPLQRQARAAAARLRFSLDVQMKRLRVVYAACASGSAR